MRWWRGRESNPLRAACKAMLRLDGLPVETHRTMLGARNVVFCRLNYGLSPRGIRTRISPLIADYRTLSARCVSCAPGDSNSEQTWFEQVASASWARRACVGPGRRTRTVAPLGQSQRASPEDPGEIALCGRGRSRTSRRPLIKRLHYRCATRPQYQGQDLHLQHTGSEPASSADWDTLANRAGVRCRTGPGRL